MRKNKSTRAKSVKATENATKKIKNVVSVESMNTTDVAALPATKAENGKVSSKDVMKAAGSIRASIREERRGANVTIRLIAELAANGDTDAVNILCALCDVPRTALYSLNINIVRNAVNSYYPYYTEVDGRRISVKPVGVWYTEKAETDEAADEAAKRVKRGYRAVEVVDYLDMLIKAAKSRAKGVTPRCVDANAIYNDIALSDAAEGVTCKEIDEAKARRVYSVNTANVWHKDRNGFYI